MISLPTFRGAIAGFNPLSLSPALWLNDTGSDPSVWTDMSGNDRHAVQATGANQPSIETNIINGKQVRRFNGTTTRLIPPDFNLNNCTVFSVVKPNVSTSIPNATFSIGDSAGNGRDILVYFGLDASILSSSVIRNITGGPYLGASALAANSTEQITTSKYTGTQLISYVNNGTRGITSATNTGSTTNKPSIGASIASTGTIYFYTGDIAELIVYPTSLSDFNCLQVERYLGAKYNIPVGYDPDAVDYFNRITTAGSSITTANKNAVNAFITGCKADGIWPAIKASCLLAGPDDLTGALVPLVGTAPTNVNFVSGDYNRTTGLLGNGTTKYLNSNRALNSDPQNNHHLSSWSTAAATAGVLIGGGGSGLASSVLGRSPASTWPFRSRIGAFDGTSQGSRSTASITGFIGVSRSTSANCISRLSASNETILSVSTTSTSDNSFVFARNGGGSPAGYSTDRISFYSTGEAIDLALLDARLTTYMASLT